jgi:hypothetical protein
MCQNPTCVNKKQSNNEGYCPECGQQLTKLGFQEAANLKKMKKGIKNDKNYVLFHQNSTYDDINQSIDKDMANFSKHEAGTKGRRIGTLFSLKPTDQMIGAGFKAIIDQNKILIKQNELLLRELRRINNGK